MFWSYWMETLPTAIHRRSRCHGRGRVSVSRPVAARVPALPLLSNSGDAPSVKPDQATLFEPLPAYRPPRLDRRNTLPGSRETPSRRSRQACPIPTARRADLQRRHGRDQGCQALLSRRDGMLHALKLSHDFAPAVTKLPSESMSLIGSGSAAASGDMMLLDAIALLILAGMMFIPLVNVIVGVVVGAGLAGPPGALCGLMSALAITAAQKMIRQHKAWFHFSPADGRDPF